MYSIANKSEHDFGKLFKLKNVINLIVHNIHNALSLMCVISTIRLSANQRTVVIIRNINPNTVYFTCTWKTCDLDEIWTRNFRTLVHLVDLPSQQVERRTSIPKVRVEISSKSQSLWWRLWNKVLSFFYLISVSISSRLPWSCKQAQ